VASGVVGGSVVVAGGVGVSSLEEPQATRIAARLRGASLSFFRECTGAEVNQGGSRVKRGRL
jgi:hypothetical protein